MLKLTGENFRRWLANLIAGDLIAHDALCAYKMGRGGDPYEPYENSAAGRHARQIEEKKRRPNYGHREQ